MQPAGQDPEGEWRARNSRTTALFAAECQSFLDNVIAGLEQLFSAVFITNIAGSDFRHAQGVPSESPSLLQREADQADGSLFLLLGAILPWGAYG